MSEFTVEVPVRFSDLDVFGHVNHSRYLSYCEEHRSDFFASWVQVCDSDPLDGSFVVANVAADYFAPITRHDRSVQVRMSVDRVGTSSLGLRYQIDLPARQAATVTYTLVMVDPQGRPRPLSESERTFVAQFRSAEAAQ